MTVYEGNGRRAPGCNNMTLGSPHPALDERPDWRFAVVSQADTLPGQRELSVTTLQSETAHVIA